MDWLITNIQKPSLPENCTRRYDGDGFSLFTGKPLYIDEQTSVGCLLDGYVLNRLHLNRTITNEKQLVNLYFQYGEQFIKHFKGYFSVIVMKDNYFRIFSDHLGLKKFFYYISDDVFLISSSIDALLLNVPATFDRRSIIQHSLFNRFVGRGTPYKNIGHNRPAMTVQYSGKITIDTYWKYGDLTGQQAGRRGMQDITDYFRRILRGYLDALQPGRVSVPLNGGVACRTILAGLLAEETTPVTYGYAHPESNDGKYGKLTADELFLEFTHHHFKADAAGYSELVNEIRHNGNGIVSPHRAYRLYGMKQASTYSKIIFLGHLGEEMIQGPVFDDLVVSRPVRETWEGKLKLIDIVTGAFRRAYFRDEKSDMEYAKYELTYFNKGNIEERFARHLFGVHAHLHAAQDLMLIDRYATPVPVYLDIDYLTMLFSSRYNYLHARGFRKNELRSQRNLKYHSSMMQYLQPSLIDIPLGNHRTPRTYLRNRFAASIASAIRGTFHKKNYKPKFSYAPWYSEYITGELNNNAAYTEYFDLSDIDIADINPSTEAGCFPFTRIAETGHLLARLYRASAGSEKEIVLK